MAISGADLYACRLARAFLTRQLSHLDRLEAEAIHVFREVAATFAKPVMLYSVGKDSSVLLHLAMKAFYPAPPPFPFLHVDTRWKFKEMYAFRDRLARELGFDLLVHINPDGIAQNMNPFDFGIPVLLCCLPAGKGCRRC